MPISSSEYEKSSAVGGWCSFIERYTDDAGKTYYRQYKASEAYTPNLTTGTTVLDDHLADSEVNRYLADAERGSDLVNITPSEQTKLVIWKRILKAYRNRPASFAINILPLLIHINATYTDTQIKNFLGITQAKLDAIRSRATGLTTLKAQLDADDLLIEAEE